jgi:alpha-aminoadipate carrier protein LysW
MQKSKFPMMENEIVTCPDCGASYELIKSNNGFAIRPAQSVGEDWGE